MKRTDITGCIAALTLAALLLADDKKATVIMQSALARETVQGDLKGAIALYQNAFKEAGSNRALAAEALVRIAEAYQKMGDAESRKIFERVVREYGDQKDAVTVARSHLGSAESPMAISTRRVWTAPAKADFYGQVSPNGRYIPYTNWAEKGNLFLHDSTTGTERRLTDTGDDVPGGSGEFAEEAAFSRDNRYLAYTWSMGNKGGVELRVVGLQDAGVPKPRSLVVNQDLKWISPYSWSPDGSSIAVQLQRKDRTGQLAIVSVKDGSLLILKSVDWRNPQGVFFSPDGKYLAYDAPAAGDATGQHDIFVLSTDGSREIAAVVHPSRDAVIGWSPDGKRLLFTSDRSGSMGLWALSFSDGKPQGKPELLKSDLGKTTLLGVSASGAVYSAVYNPGEVPAEIMIAGFDFREGKFLSKPAPAAQSFLGTNILPSWSPDGKYIAYVSMRNSHVAIGIRSMDTGQIRELLPFPNFTPSMGYWRMLSWAQDGNSFIVIARGDKNGFAAYRIDAHSGQSSLIVGSGMVQAAALSPDGNTLYYKLLGQNHDHVLLIKRDLRSGEETELLRRKLVLGGVTLSPDGRFIGMVVSNDASLSPVTVVLVPTAGGSSREILQRGTAAIGEFSPDGRYAVVRTVDASTKSNAISIIPVDGGEARELMRGPDSRLIVPAAWAQDSRSVLVKKSSPEWEQSELWSVPVDGSSPRKLDGNVDHVAGRFLPSPDWKHVAFQTPRSERKATEIWVLENLLPNLATKK